MHKQRINFSLWLAAGSTVALLLVGCQTQPTGTATAASGTPSPSYYRGQSLPSEVDKLSGTPLYTTSEDIAKKAKIDGAPFLLIAPQNPSQALLVVESGSTPKDLAGRASNLSDFTGTTESLDAPALVEFVKESFGLELKVDEAGKIVVLRVSSIKSSSTPKAASTP